MAVGLADLKMKDGYPPVFVLYRACDNKRHRGSRHHNDAFPYAAVTY